MATSQKKFILSFLKTLGIAFAVIIFCVWYFYVAHVVNFQPSSNAGDDWFLANYGGTSRIGLEPDIYYHDLLGVVAEVKKADIVFLGHSEVLFGIDDAVLRSFSQKHHVRVYNMAFPGEGAADFFVQLITKHSLAPTILLVPIMLNEKPKFFSGDPMTAHARDSTVKARSKVLYDHYTWIIQYGLRAAIDIFSLKYKPQAYPRIFRSVSTGCYYNYGDELRTNAHPRDRFTAAPGERACEDVSEQCYENARSFCEFAKARGIRVVFFNPPQATCLDGARSLAAYCDVEFSSFDDEEFSFLNEWHLDHRGAVKYTSLLLAWLENSNTFRSAFTSNSN